MDSYIELLKAFLPEPLITHFDIKRHKKENDKLHLYFEEKKSKPLEFTSSDIIGHGFHKEITIEDFPIRGRKVLLHIKQRRWLDKQTRQVLQRDWTLIAQGTRMTSEFAAFLKEISRY